jgi:hypothetical protein
MPLLHPRLLTGFQYPDGVIDCTRLFPVREPEEKSFFMGMRCIQ